MLIFFQYLDHSIYLCNFWNKHIWKIMQKKIIVVYEIFNRFITEKIKEKYVENWGVFFLPNVKLCTLIILTKYIKMHKAVKIFYVVKQFR